MDQLFLAGVNPAAIGQPGDWLPPRTHRGDTAGVLALTHEWRLSRRAERAGGEGLGYKGRKATLDGLENKLEGVLLMQT